MFLTRGIIPYEDTWRQFLAAVPERVPGGSAAGWRALFSVYVHLPPDLAYPEGSLFAGHEIAGRIAVEWGQWSVVRAPRPDPPPPASRCRGHPPHASCISKCASAAAAAARACARRPGTHMKTARRPRRSALLRAALADAGNQRFVLVSETCIPLYPGPVVWAQLAGEPRSRLHACRNDSDPADAGRRMAFRRAPGPARPPRLRPPDTAPYPRARRDSLRACRRGGPEVTGCACGRCAHP